jgi:hypothetical protein
MWTPVMTRLNCQTGEATNATGQGYKGGTGYRTCPRGQAERALLAGAQNSQGSNLAISTGALRSPDTSCYPRRAYGICADTSEDNPLSSFVPSTAVTT